MGQNELKTPNIKQLLRTLNSPRLDCLFFSNGPTMNASDFATMISRIVATPAAGVVNG
jgi:ribonucleotide monophosphatase NagD (HAD superfamily)